MKKSLVLGITVLSLAALVDAQENGIKVFTRPKPPSREVLDRLGLAQAWRTKIPIASQRDGLFSVQIIPARDAKDPPEVVVQTYAGMVYLLDSETGDILWRTQVGEPYWPGQPVAYNSHSILATRREYLYALNRANGAHRLYTMDPDSKQRSYGFPLGGAPSSAPTADDGG